MREGERPALVDWASAARGRPLQAKVFNDPEEPEVILAPAPGVALDAAREHLADRIWRSHHGGACYGLQIQGLTLAPSKGVRLAMPVWRLWRRHEPSTSFIVFGLVGVIAPAAAMPRIELVCAPHLAHGGVGGLRPVQAAGMPASL